MRRLADLLKGLAALIGAIAMVVIVPAGLVVYVGWPLPTRLPSLEQVGLSFRSGLDPQLLINTLAVVVWLTWAQIVAALGSEVVAAVRGRTARRLPIFPGLQTAATHLVTAITIAASTLGPLRTVATATSSLNASAVVADPNISFQPHRSQGAEEVAPGRGPAEADRAAYRVAKFETLWKVAEKTLGDGRRWQEVRRLNVGRVMADGNTITAATESLLPDWLLLLPDDAQVPDPDDTPIPVRETVVVEPGDHFWKFAEETLELGWGRRPSDLETADYWRDLVEQNRPNLPAPYDPDLIQPGQTYDLPPIPTDPGSSSPHELGVQASNFGAGWLEVKAGDSFWTIAQHTLDNAWNRAPSNSEITGYWQRLVAANRDRLLPPHDPDLIYPGQTIRLPSIVEGPRTSDKPDTVAEGTIESQAVAPPEPESDSPPSEDPAGVPEADNLPENLPQPMQPPTVPSTEPGSETIRPPGTPEPTHREPSPPLSEEIDDHDENSSGELLPIASTLAGLGVLAAGITALLRRLRIAQLRHRRSGTIPTPPPPETAAVEAAMTVAAAPNAAEFVNLALRALARTVTTSHLPPPQLVGVLIDDQVLRVLLWTPRNDAPSGWQVDDDGRSWTLSTHIDSDHLRQLAKGIPAPYPSLVTVGHGDRSQILLDLEYLGAVQLSGDPEDVTATCITMATEFATSAIADTLQIVCVGFGHHLANLERVRIVDTLEEILGEVDRKAAAINHLASVSPLESRLSPASGDSWEPIIIFDPSPDPSEGSDRLLATAHAGRGVAAVVGYPTGDRWRLHLAEGTVRIDPLGHTFARRNLTQIEQSAVADLIVAAKDLEGNPVDLTTEPDFLSQPDEPVDASPKQVGLFDSEWKPKDEAPAPQSPTVSDLQVRVLGPIRIEGLVGHFPLRKCTELAAYLTFHRLGVEADKLMEVLWPEQPPDFPRLNRHTSRTRTTMGNDIGGQPYLPFVTDGLYRVSSQLGNDLEQFTNLIKEADRTPSLAAQHLRAALELIEGAPFTGAGNSYTWAYTDGIITHSIVAIDNAAHRLAQLALDKVDLNEVAWAARKGLMATGACEECYRNLMRAAIAEGNQIALEAVYTELVAVVDADEGPDAAGFLDPETIELYEDNTRRRRRAG